MLVRLGQTLMLLASARGAAGRHRSRQHFRRKLPPDVIADVNTMFSEMTAYHPQCPHWYLPTIGVEPHFHGKGFGSRLLTETLKQCDQEHMPAYLEPSNHSFILAVRL